MSQPFPPVSLANIVSLPPVRFDWSQAIIRPTLSQLQAGLSEHLELYNASMHTLTISLDDTTVAFTLVPQAIKRLALPNTSHALTAVVPNAQAAQRTAGLNALVPIYYGPAESQETFTIVSAPPDNGTVTSSIQTIVSNTTWSPGAISPIQLTLAPTLGTRIPFLTELIIFHGNPQTAPGGKDYGIIGKSYSVNISSGLASVMTIAANYERPGTIFLPFSTAYTIGAQGVALTCGVLLDNNPMTGAFVYSGGVTMIGYEL